MYSRELIEAMIRKQISLVIGLYIPKSFGIKELQ